MVPINEETAQNIQWPRVELDLLAMRRRAEAAEKALAEARQEIGVLAYYAVMAVDHGWEAWQSGTAPCGDFLVFAHEIIDREMPDR